MPHPRTRNRQSAFVKWSDIPKHSEPLPMVMESQTPSEAAMGLADANGGWAPAPVEWEGRPSFYISDAEIEKWIDKTFEAISDQHTAMPMCVLYYDGGENPDIALFCDSLDPDTEDNIVYGKTTFMGAIAPHYWIPEHMEHDLNAATFWEYQKGTPPRPASDVDNSETTPWWQTYPAINAFFLAPLEDVETHNGPLKFDPREENKKEKAARLADKGSQAATDRRLEQRRARLERQQAARERQLALRNAWPAPSDAVSGATAVDTPAPATPLFKPKLDITIRPATDLDVAALCDIYNAYVRHSCVVPDAHPCSKNSMLSRLHAIQAASFPFLVAAKVNGGKVVGMVYADDFHGEEGVYRYTGEVEVFVAPAFVEKGVGTALMDAVMKILSREYEGRVAGVKVAAGMDVGVRRRVKSLVCNLPYWQGERPDWLVKWMEGFGWQVKGCFEDMGVKNDRMVDLAILQVRTGEKVAAGVPRMDAW